MKRTSTLLFATLLTAVACNGRPAEQGTDDDKQSSADKASKQADAKEDAADDKRPKEEPRVEEPAKAGALAESGIPVGGKMRAFDIINCDTGKLYCQVCQYGSSPKLMAVGSPDDEGFKKDLAALQALVDKMGKRKVKAFAVVTDKKDGQLMPLLGEEAEAMKARAKAIKDELKLSMPVVVPAAKDKDGNDNTTFIEHYKVTKSRTVMFANGKNEVKYSAVAPGSMTELEKTIAKNAG